MTGSMELICNMDGVIDKFTMRKFKRKTSFILSYINAMLTDQGSVFMAAEWNYVCASSDIYFRHRKEIPQQSRCWKTLSFTATPHTPEGISRASQSYKRCVCLDLSVRAMNVTLGPEGLVPSLLVFGVLPRLPSVCKK
jgi:hypothetical protein